ncbi:MAG TPA: sigma-54 dependent transcriptional regulator [Sandaracinaceae bacterium LLY-WYZ-13_1]|nr:sigma-54 dependent transcriptional regulator [Sandaracinaceae bacterium LLY-WYZ-13_1]
MSADPRGLGPVTLVDDDPVVRRLMHLWLESEGYAVREHEDGRHVLQPHDPAPGVVCLDLGLEDMPGLHVLEHLLVRDPDLPIVVVTAERSIETAVSAMRAGAYDFVTKPLDRQRFLLAVARAAERRRLTERVRGLESELDGQRAMARLVGDSAPMQELGRQIKRVLASDVAVAIFGDSGTGKELVARAIHENGHRRDGDFVAVNCAAIPESLQESELFGHEKGAFTGATALHRGRFEQAQGGTLFLDEIGEMSPATQATLLRTLQERTIRRVGGSQDLPVDVRILCATHRDLEAEVEAGRFRQDLYYRLVVYPLHLPSLRERSGDIPSLVRHFVERLGGDVGHTPRRIDPAAIEALMQHDWPGNVRELQNVVHRALLACEGDVLTLAHLPPAIRDRTLPDVPPLSSAPPGRGEPERPVLPLRELEQRAIRRALDETDGNVSEAARLLGIGRATVYRRLAEMDDDPRAAARP